MLFRDDKGDELLPFSDRTEVREHTSNSALCLLRSQRRNLFLDSRAEVCQ
jgi:hypothetical protein